MVYRDGVKAKSMRGALSQQMSFGEGFIDASLYKLDDELKQVSFCPIGELLKPFEDVSSLVVPGLHLACSCALCTEIPLGIELRRGGAGSQRDVAVAVFLPAFVDGCCARCHHFDQAQSTIWRRSNQRPQPAFGQAVVEESFPERIRRRLSGYPASASTERWPIVCWISAILRVNRCVLSEASTSSLMLRKRTQKTGGPFAFC